MGTNLRRGAAGLSAGLLLIASLGAGVALANNEPGAVKTDSGTVSCGANHAGVLGVQIAATDLLTTRVNGVTLYSGVGKTRDLRASATQTGTQPWSASSTSLDIPDTKGVCLP